VESVHPVCVVPDGPRVVGGIDGDVYHYVFDDRQDCDGGCTHGVASHWTSTPDGHVRLVETTTWGGDEEPAGWYASWGACQG
jgi:hypothetical protein